MNDILREKVMINYPEVSFKLSQSEQRYVILKASECQDYDVVMWLIENGFAWSEFATLYPAHVGDLDFLKYAYDNHLEFHGDVMMYAARGGQLEVMKWLVEKDLGILEHRFLGNAAEIGHAEMAEWLVENGCVWDMYMLIPAVVSSNLKFVMWALQENDAVYDPSFVHIAASNEDRFMTRFLTLFQYLNFSELCEIAYPEIVSAFIRLETEKAVNSIKYELIMRTWHPSRVKQWCLDEDEKREIFGEEIA